MAQDMPPGAKGSAFVVVHGRRYPARKVLSQATGTPIGRFTSVQATNVLGRLGFVTGDRPRQRRKAKLPALGRPGPAKRRGESALHHDLRAHVGEWVAVRGSELLAFGPDAKTVIAQLKERGEIADAMYKVPRDLSEISGAAA